MQKPVIIRNQKCKGINWIPADKRPGSRIDGWEKIRQFMQGAIFSGQPRENPGLFVFWNCQQFIRTVPVLPRDLNGDPDDVDTNAEDHIADELRYRVRYSSTKLISGRVKGTVS
ncbi:MAG: hypothetical protein PVI90_15895, partial [Desulfobacteraceae bacterium]|jgi:hypothetical protein